MNYCTAENRTIVINFAEKKGISSLEDALDMKVAFDVLELITTPDGENGDQELYTDKQVEAVWAMLGWALPTPKEQALEARTVQLFLALPDSFDDSQFEAYAEYKRYFLLEGSDNYAPVGIERIVELFTQTLTAHGCAVPN